MNARLSKIHSKALKQFSAIMSKERDQRELAIEDERFANVEGAQWDDNAYKKREGRPRYSINKIAGAIDQIIGDQRQSRTQIKVRPVGQGADESIAKIYSGLIRNIESNSKAEQAYDAAFDGIVTGGYGGWRVETQYSEDDVFKQEIVISPLASAASSLFFGHSERYDKRDASYAFMSSWMPVEEFKEKYPDATVTDFGLDSLDTEENCSHWIRSDEIRVAEYWVKEPVTKEYALLSDGRVIDVEEEASVLDELAAEGIEIEKTRNVKTHEVVQYVMNGSEIVSDRMKWAGKYIPLIPVFGKVKNIEGKEYIRGIVRNAKDPQRIYNYAKSTEIETTALTPKDPIWLTKVNATGETARLKSFNSRNDPFMFFTPDPKNGGAVPTRTGAPAIQTALIQQSQAASLDIHATTGLEPASLGNSPELKSGKAILAQQAMGDRGSYIFNDNLQKSIEYTGEVLVDLIPKIIDTKQIVRILELDGSSENVEINADDLDEWGQTIIDEQTGKSKTINDLSVGKYDVAIEAGAAFHTQRLESSQQLMELSAQNPIFQQLATDLIAKQSNLLEGDELEKRVRKYMIKQGTIEPTEDEIEELGLNQPQQPDPQQTALVDNVNMDTVKKQAEIENKDADTMAKKVKTQKEAIEAYAVLTESILSRIEAGVPVTPKDRDLMIKQRDLLAESQYEINAQPNSEQIQGLAQIAQQPQI